MSVPRRHADHALPPILTTQAGEGLPRRRFTVVDVEAMVAAGTVGARERVELIGGELVPMAPRSLRHETMTTFVCAELARNLPDGLLVTPETSFRLCEDRFLKPDFVVYDLAIGLEGLNGAACLLAIEVSDSSLAYDLGRKANIYVGFGVGELWVIDALRLTTRIHCRPSPTGYRSVRDERAEAELAAERVEAFRLRLSDHI